MFRKILDTASLVSKTVLLSLAAAGALYVGCLLVGPSVIEAFTLNHGHAKIHGVTLLSERLASHFILVQKNHESLGLCTGTAIGPHAIMSASHCDEHGGVTSITIDYTTEEHKVLRRESDGRDHLIWFIGGTPLRNLVPVAQVAPALNEIVIIYGVGGGAYPPVEKYGHVVSCEDPSDVDADAGMTCYTVPGIPGDSGSAMYNSKGEIVSLLTYGDFEQKPHGVIGFTLNFTQSQLDDARNFTGVIPPTKASDFEKDKCNLFSVFSTSELPCH